MSHGAGSRWRRKAKSCEQYCLRAGFFSARRVGARQLRISSFGDVATPIQGEVLAKRVRAQRRSGPSTARAKGEKRAARPSVTLRAAARRGAVPAPAGLLLGSKHKSVLSPWVVTCRGVSYARPAGTRGRCDVVAYRRACGGTFRWLTVGVGLSMICVPLSHCRIHRDEYKSTL